MPTPIRLADLLDIADLRQIDPSLLPPRLRLLVRLWGMEATLRHCEAHGGRVYYVPAPPGTGTLLATLVGDHDAAALARELGPDVIYLPRADKALAQVRNAYLRSRTTEEVVQAAAQWGISVRWVQQIRAGKSQPG